MAAVRRLRVCFARSVVWCLYCSQDRCLAFFFIYCSGSKVRGASGARNNQRENITSEVVRILISQDFSFCMRWLCTTVPLLEGLYHLANKALDVIVRRVSVML